MEYPALDRIESLVNGLSRMGDDLTAKLAGFSETLSEGTSDSGMVVVRVRSTGAITDVQLNPRAMRMFSEDLAAEFRQAVTRAQEAASDAAKEQVRTLLEPLPTREERGAHDHGC